MVTQPRFDRALSPLAPGCTGLFHRSQCPTQCSVTFPCVTDGSATTGSPRRARAGEWGRNFARRTPAAHHLQHSCRSHFATVRGVLSRTQPCHPRGPVLGVFLQTGISQVLIGQPLDNCNTRFGATSPVHYGYSHVLTATARMAQCLLEFAIRPLSPSQRCGDSTAITDAGAFASAHTSMCRTHGGTCAARFSTTLSYIADGS
jgi:hypothetical protein